MREQGKRVVGGWGEAGAAKVGDQAELTRPRGSLGVEVNWAQGHVQGGRPPGI